MKVGPASRAGGDLDDPRIRNSIDPDITFAVPAECARMRFYIIGFAIDFAAIGARWIDHCALQGPQMAGVTAH